MQREFSAKDSTNGQTARQTTVGKRLVPQSRDQPKKGKRENNWNEKASVLDIVPITRALLIFNLLIPRVLPASQSLCVTVGGSKILS